MLSCRHTSLRISTQDKNSFDFYVIKCGFVVALSFGNKVVLVIKVILYLFNFKVEPWLHMSWSSNSEFVQKLITQNIFEQQTIRRFDRPSFDQFPIVAILILRIWGFGMVHIMGIDPKQAQIAYLVVKSTTMALEPVF